MLFRKISNYASLVKFSHTVFAMPFAIIGYLLGLQTGGKSGDYLLLVLILLCMVFARSAAMAFNRLADRRIDEKNPRTRDREIPAGKVSVRAAIIFVGVSSLLFVATTWFINLTCFFLSPLALIIILGYSYTKRFTSLSHYVLGLGLSLAPIGAYLAVNEIFDWVPVLYSGLVLTWVGGFDIIYALQDQDFDRQEKLHSVPARLGIVPSLWISGISHLFSVFFLVLAGILGHNGVFFWSGALIFTVIVFIQHLLVGPGKLHRVRQVFALTNGFAGVILAGFYILDYFIFIDIGPWLF